MPSEFWVYVGAAVIGGGILIGVIWDEEIRMPGSKLPTSGDFIGSLMSAAVPALSLLLLAGMLVFMGSWILGLAGGAPNYFKTMDERAELEKTWAEWQSVRQVATEGYDALPSKWGYDMLNSKPKWDLTTEEDYQEILETLESQLRYMRHKIEEQKALDEAWKSLTEKP